MFKRIGKHSAKHYNNTFWSAPPKFSQDNPFKVDYIKSREHTISSFFSDLYACVLGSERWEAADGARPGAKAASLSQQLQYCPRVSQEQAGKAPLTNNGISYLSLMGQSLYTVENS